MKKNTAFIMVSILVVLMACNSQKEDKSLKDNPFLSDYNTPFEVPPFDKIDSTHYMPAFIEGMRLQNEEIDKIVNNKEDANFENTILAFDKSGRVLNKVRYVFDNITSAHTNDQLDNIARESSPLLSKHRDEIAMNEKLFARIKKVYDNRNTANLDAQQIRVTEKYFKDFERKGANLPKDKQEELKKINMELSDLCLKFKENHVAETNKNFKLILSDVKELEGLPQGVIDAAAITAKENKLEGKWVFTLQGPSIWPFMQYSKNRDLREKLYKAYINRGNNNNEFDNKKLLSQIFNLRVKQAKLLGFNNYASFAIDVNMAKTPQKVDEFLMKIWNAALPIAKNEVKEMQKIVDAEGGKFKIEPWDWWYYAEKVRKAKFDLDDNEIKPYFVLENVQQAMFDVATKLYGITFNKLSNVPLYQEDVVVYEVKEADGKHLGILYLDYYPRTTKSSGAWCTSFRESGWYNNKKEDPIVSICCNLTKPAGNVPSLLNFDEVTTMFHEFGHGLHSLFAEGKYSRITGDVPRDYVELPSQVMENWAYQPEVIKMYGKHYKTGEAIPDALIEKIKKSSEFNQGFETVEYIAASLLDLAYHNISENQDLSIPNFEKNAMDKIGLIPEISPRYRSTYFLHIIEGGYSAGYYVYYWAKVLDADAFSAFKESGDLFNKELAAKFRKHCLQECGNDEGMTQYIKFRGKEPSIDALLERNGLK